ncbi:MAG: TatD family nuclease-associated radical SAM protein [Candidatus Margulisiibacteriota bacterium]
MGVYSYELNDCLYLNITNRCNNACTFCIKFRSRRFEDKHELWLSKEPLAEEVVKGIPDPSKYRQIVFCGYGEPLIRLAVVKEISRSLKEKGAMIRINTDGLANLFHGRNILPELAVLVDEIYISLNAHNSDTYQKLCLPVFGAKAYNAIKDFAEEAKKVVPTVVLTAVDLPSVDIEKCKAIAEKIGVEFKVRPYYEKSYQMVQ